MIIQIPDFGETELESLPVDYCYGAVGDENYNFKWIEKNGRKCILCDPENSVALAEMLLDNEPFARTIIDYRYPDIDYWFFVRNEFCIGNALELIISELFKVFINNGIIKKLKNEKFKSITAAEDDYIYVFLDYSTFNLDEHTDIRYQLGKTSLSVLDEVRNQLLDMLDEIEFDGKSEKEESLKTLNDEYELNKLFILNEIESLEKVINV